MSVHIRAFMLKKFLMIWKKSVEEEKRKHKQLLLAETESATSVSQCSDTTPLELDF